MEKQESKIRFPTFPQPLRLRNITSYGIRNLRARSVHRDGKTLAHGQIANYFDCIARGLRPSGVWKKTTSTLSFLLFWPLLHCLALTGIWSRGGFLCLG